MCYNLTGVISMHRTIGLLLLGVLALNLIDYGLTLRALSLGATEGNPIMDWMLQRPPAFDLYKLVAVPSFLVAVWRLRHRVDPRRMAYYAWAVFLPYLSLMGWHVYGLATS